MEKQKNIVQAKKLKQTMSFLIFLVSDVICEDFFYVFDFFDILVFWVRGWQDLQEAP